MAYDFPPDLLDLQRAFLTLDARCQEISAGLPTASDIIAGTPVDFGELDKARAERLNIVEALSAHPWWETLDKGDRGNAKTALRAAAQSQA